MKKVFKSILAILLTTGIIGGMVYYYFIPIPHKYALEGLMATKIDVNLVAYRNQDTDKIVKGLYKELARLEKIFSSYSADSELTKVNRLAYDEEVELSGELYTVIDTALKYSKLTDGAFDITVFPLVKLWKVTKKDFIPPSQKQIKETLNNIGYQYVQLKDKKIRFLKKDIQLVLGGISKGYIIDKGVEYLKSQGVGSGILNIGGDLYVFGKNHGSKKWMIGIRHPRNRNSMSNIGGMPLENKAMATSGDYERYKMSQGKRYHHLLNPKTGYPVEKTISVSIIATNSMLADVVATSVFILGPKKGIEFIKSHKDIDAIIIYKDSGKIKSYLTSGIKLVNNKID